MVRCMRSSECRRGLDSARRTGMPRHNKCRNIEQLGARRVQCTHIVVVQQVAVKVRLRRVDAARVHRVTLEEAPLPPVARHPPIRLTINRWWQVVHKNCLPNLRMCGLKRCGRLLSLRGSTPTGPGPKAERSKCMRRLGMACCVGSTVSEQSTPNHPSSHLQKPCKQTPWPEQ